MSMPIACCKSLPTIMSYRGELSVSSTATNHLISLLGAKSMKEKVSSMSHFVTKLPEFVFQTFLFGLRLSFKYCLGRRFALTPIVEQPLSFKTFLRTKSSKLLLLTTTANSNFKAVVFVVLDRVSR
jgi:hypothetical protein